MNKSYTQSPNLLNKDIQDSKSLLEKSHPKIIYAIKLTIILVEAAFILTLVLDAKASKDISKLQENVSALENKVKQKSAVETEIIKTINKTERYKEIKNSQVKIGENVGLVLNNIPKDILLENINFESGTSKITAQASSAVSLSLFISKLLEAGVSEISLTSANLITERNVFEVGLEISFK